ncbi:protein terminal ear1 homolog [Raphanus sativus]|uniref:Protein terminal ear1 homolog n=1 Tax=Raphanus sativus TaxID=3726 RepID=A0A6J0KNN7_RAPSA|nr:protein terminal ear1 homolog [Raphanus sativus]
MALPLNPKAPEFYPKTRAQEPNFPSRSTFSVKPGKLRQPRCLPPRLLKQKVWVHKNRNFLPRKPLPPPKESELKSLPSPQEDTFKSLFGDKTSVMIRNVPNIFGRKDLLRILDNHCRRENKVRQQTPSSYDFLYLPMDFVKHANLGYAFVNFTSSVAAERFRREYDNFLWVDFGYKKICKISVAKYQGKEEYYQHFKDSRFPCHTDVYLPVILSPPSDGFTRYSLRTLGYRVSIRGSGPRRGIQVA